MRLERNDMDGYNKFINSKYGLFISFGGGMLFYFICGGSRIENDFAGMCLGMFLFVLGMSLTGGALFGIPHLYKKAVKKREISTNNWELPAEQILEKCASTGIINVTDERTYNIARSMVLSVLSKNNIPEKYHNRYLEKETIQKYFQTLHTSRQWEQSEVVQKAIRFYKECCEANADDLSVKSKREKAALILRKYFTAADVDTILNEGRRAYYADIEAKEKKELAEISKTERSAKSDLEHYKRYHGRDKLLAILRDEQSRCQEEVDTLEAAYDSILKYGNNAPKETSWGLAGGIAEGIAGPAAGVAAAIEVQKQNAANRAIYEARLKDVASALLFLSGKIGSAKTRLSNIQESYKTAQTLLAQDDKPDVYFSKLEIGTPKIDVSKTGTITVKVDVAGKPFTIYDDRPAKVDGSLTAHIFEGKKEISQATLVFPKQGAAYKTTLTGMALFCGKANTQYSVKLSPNDLWAIEK